MTEDEARGWIRAHFGVSRETLVAEFIALVADEATRQNLVSASSLTTIWRRHVVDSAQLIGLAMESPGRWADIGTGAGFPGMVVALLTERPVTLIEPRRGRAEFLSACAAALGIADRVSVIALQAQKSVETAAIISARAVASLAELLELGAHLSAPDTLWLLPKGQSAREEVAAAQRTWHGSFHVEHSITEPGSLIITAKGVARR